MKTLKFNVEISFTHYIDTEKEIQQVVDNIVAALTKKVEEDGLAPDTEDVMTTTFIVTSLHSPNISSRKFIMNDIS